MKLNFLRNDILYMQDSVEKGKKTKKLFLKSLLSFFFSFIICGALIVLLIVQDKSLPYIISIIIGYLLFFAGIIYANFEALLQNKIKKSLWKGSIQLSSIILTIILFTVSVIVYGA